MASDAREERQLMRQRGAGSRDVANTDFDLGVGTGTREERLLMRQRGTGNRQINDIDFGFAFTTPSQLRQSRTRSKTPQTASRNAGQPTKTPIRTVADTLQPALPSVRSTRSLRPPSANGLDGTAETIAGPLRKRRRLSEVSNITRATSVELPFSSEAIGVIHEEAEDALAEASYELPMVYEQDEEDQGDIVPSSNLFFPDEGPNKENETPAPLPHKPAPKRRKRKSIGQQSIRRKKRSSSTSRTQIPSPPKTQEDATADNNDTEVGEEDEEEPADAAASTANIDGRQHSRLVSPPSTQSRQVSETTPSGQSQPKRRKKRKSITFGRQKRRSTGTASRVSAPTDESIADAEENEQPTIQHEPDHEPETDTDPEDEQPRSARSGRPPVGFTQRLSPEELEYSQPQIHDDNSEASDQEYQPDEGTPEPTPAPSRKKGSTQQQRKRPTSSRPISSAQPRAPKRRKSTFPILTHRITNTQHLPTITEEAEAEAEPTSGIDELSLPPPTFTTRQTPNAVDVLAQICREIIDSAISNLQTQGQTKGMSRSELKRKVAALETFGVELDARLFDVSQSLDQRLHLEARLRKLRREKAEVQARWLELRKRRDQIALRADDIRRRHWEGEVMARRAWEVSESAGRAEAEAQAQRNEVGEVAVAEGGRLEAMLRTLAGDVSNAEGGGVLNRLKSFNAQLERLAGVLDGR